MPQPHLDSFNFMLGEGIQEAVRLLPRIEVPSVLLDRQTKVPGVTTPERVKTLSMWIEDVKFGWPLRNGSGSDDVRYLPRGYDHSSCNDPNRSTLITSAQLVLHFELQVVPVGVSGTWHHVRRPSNRRD